MDQVARVIEGQLQVAHIFRIGIGLHHRDRSPRFLTDPGGIGAVALGVRGRQVGVRMPAHHGVDACDAGRDLQIARQPHMGQRDDLGHALRLQLGHIGAQAVDLVLKDHVGAGAGGLDRVGRQRRDDADLLAPHLEHGVILHPARQQVVAADIGVAGNHREGDTVEKGRERLGAVVEFVVAHGHRVKADGFHHLGLDRALVGRVHQAALKLVACIEHDDIAAFGADRITQFFDLSGDAGDAPEALVFGCVLFPAGRIRAADRLDPAVQVVDVQNVQRVLGLGRGGGETESRGDEQS